MFREQTMSEVNVDSIARLITFLIQDEVDKHTANDVETAFLNMIYEIENEYTDAKALYDDMKEHGYTVNTIETEGYLRAMTRVMSIVDCYRPEK